MNFKKYPLVTASVSLLSLGCFVGIGFCCWQAYSNSVVSDSVNKSESVIKQLLNPKKGFALSDANVDVEKANLEDLKKTRDAKIGYLVNKPSLTLNFSGEPTQLNSRLTEYTQEWRNKLEKNDILQGSRLGNFGFDRYVRVNGEIPKRDALRLIATEAKIVALLVDDFVKARTAYEKSSLVTRGAASGKGLPVILRAVKREAAEVVPAPGARAQLSLDEISIELRNPQNDDGFVRLTDANTRDTRDYFSMRRKGVIDAIAFQVNFVGHTEIFRSFIKGLSGYPIYVRDVVVRPVTDDVLGAVVPSESATASVRGTPAAAPAAGDFSVFSVEPTTNAGEGSTAPLAHEEPTKQVVLKEKPSEFVVTLEYVAPVKAEAQKSDNEEQE